MDLSAKPCPGYQFIRLNGNQAFSAMIQDFKNRIQGVYRQETTVSLALSQTKGSR
jgi:hypothetical protein